MTAINSCELNYMVYRYLVESGFQHTAFNLGYEAAIDKITSIDADSVPPGALLTFVQKGIQYLEMEANLKVKDLAEDFIFIKPFDLLKNNVSELKKAVEDNKRKAAEELKELSWGKEIEHSETNHVHKVNYKLRKGVPFGGPEPMDMSTSSLPQSHGVHCSDLLLLQGHSAEVCACAWSPAGLVLATGSGDSTARIWSIVDRTNSSSLINRIGSVCVLKHYEKSKPNERRKSINTVDWNSEGTLLATGSHDGLARIWNTNGELMSVLKKHKGPVLSVKWNKKGDHLLTASSDRRAIIWDVNSNEHKQQFKFHSGPALDVDWRTNHTFASGLSDGSIYICKIGEKQPVKVFSGHKDEVNCVKWDPSALLLASCSDDITAKVWSLKQDAPIHDFKDHIKEVYAIKWSPTGFGTDKRLLLASASFDSTVKLWDVEYGSLFHSLNGHRDAVYCISFSPNGEYLASGSRDKSVNIWSVKDGRVVKTYVSNGSVSQVSWTKDGGKIAYSTNSNSVFVSDVRM